MVEATSFPEGFGSDPTIMADARPAGTATRGIALDMAGPPEPTEAARTARQPLSKDAEMLPLTARYDAAQGGELHPAARHVGLSAEGFHLGPSQRTGEDEADRPRPSERRSVVIATVLVGLVLAGLGYFLDFH